MKLNRLFLSALFAVMLFSATGQSLVPLWETERVLQVPESVLYDRVTQNIYVSCINGNPSAKDGNGYIAKLDKNGKILKLKWITGLNAPKGMAVRNGKLFVSDIDRVAEINIKTGKIVRFYPVAGAEFLNDVAIDKNGNVYISDSGKGVIYKLANGEVKLWLDGSDLKGVNGLNLWQGKLLAGASGKIWQIDLKTGEKKALVEAGGMIDGLIPVGNHRFIISDWKGKVQLTGINIPPVVLRNTTNEKINAADLGYIYEERTLLIPTFFDNRVAAFKLTE